MVNIEHIELRNIIEGRSKGHEQFILEVIRCWNCMVLDEFEEDIKYIDVEKFMVNKHVINNIILALDKNGFENFLEAWGSNSKRRYYAEICHIYIKEYLECIA